MTANGKRVLVVDDEDVVCRSYERVLTQAGFEVGKAHSGAEALAAVRARDYDVMLADLKMPGMDGLQVVEQLRGTHPDMPVVVITGFPSQDTLRAAARLGVTDYLTKPIAPDVLTEATMQALAAPWRGGGRPLVLQMPQLPEVGPMPAPRQLPTGGIVWPDAPAALPAAREAASVAPAVETAPEVAPAVPAAEPRHGRLDTAARLALAPFVSLAYVLFLPFLGIGMFVGLGAKALWRKLGGLM